MVSEAVASSWRRTDRAGLDPARPLDAAPTAEVDLGGPLLHAAAPVLDDLDERLRDTPFCTILVDRDGHVVRRWAAARGVDRLLDELHLSLGTSLHEDDIGTNGLGTPLEAGAGVSVDGEEHFLEVLRQFSCYGQPIRHPVTRRVEGVLDITTLSEFANPLLPPLVSRAVAEIEQRLLDGGRASEKRLLDAFRVASGLQRRPVVAIGEDLLMSNRAALELVGPGDVGRLRALVADGTAGPVPVELESGRTVDVVVTTVRGTRGGALLEVRPVDRPARTTHAPVDTLVLVSGPPGSGRTTRARQLAVGARVLDAGLDDESWLAGLAAPGPLVVDDLDRLDPARLAALSHKLAEPGRARVVLTSGPVESLTGPAAAVAGTATRRETTLPLAARRADLPAIAARMLAEIEPGEHLHLMPGAVAALVAQSWPGGLTELHAVLTHATQRRWGTAIAVKDLPDGYRSEVPERPLPPLERAQRDVIVATLRRHDGNKVSAAKELGLSRTTLYARMKALRITTW